MARTRGVLNRSARGHRNDLSDKRPILEIHHAIRIHVGPGVEARLTRPLAERTLHDRKVLAIRSAVCVQVAVYVRLHIVRVQLYTGTLLWTRRLQGDEPAGR